MASPGVGRARLELLLACVGVTVAGSALTFAIDPEPQEDFGTPLKYIGSVGLLVAWPLGLAFDCFGPRPVFTFALVCGGIANFMLYTVARHQSYYASHRSLVIAYWILYGLGCVALYMASASLLLNRCNPAHSGLVLGCSGLLWWFWPAVYSTSTHAYTRTHQPVETDAALFVGCGLILVTVNITAIAVFKRTDGDDDDDYKTGEGTAICEALDAVHHGGGYFPESHSVLRSREFWLLTAAFALGDGVQTTMVDHLSVILASITSHTLKLALVWVGALADALGKVICGKLSDSTLMALERMTYLLLAAVVNSLVTFLSIFFGDHALIFTLNYIFIRANMGIYWCLTPIVIHDYFGTRRFATLWGFVVTVNCLCTLVLRLVLGHFSPLGAHCQGDSCYQTWCILCFSGCLTSAIFLLAILPSEQQSLERWKRRVRAASRHQSKINLNRQGLGN